MNNYEVNILDTDINYECLGEQNLLDGMVKLGMKGIPVGCRGGGCGICKVKIHKGTYNCKKMSRAHVSEVEEQEGFVLACRCNPDSNIEIEVVGHMKKSIY